MSFKIILVSNYEKGIGLPYYYYKAFGDIIGDQNVDFIGEKSRNHSIHLHKRVKRKILEKSGITAKQKISAIKDVLDKNKLNIIILFNTSNLPFDLIKDLSKEDNLKLVHYISDHPLGMFSPRKEITIATAPLFDLIAAFGHDHVPMFYQWGAKKVVRVPFAYCRYTHYEPVKNISPVHSDQIYYFGTWTPDIENWLTYLLKYDLHIEGTHWQFAKNKELVRIGSKKNPKTENNMSIQAGKSGLTVNFTRAQHGCLHSMKTFELAIAGACILCNRSNEQMEFFEEDKEYIYFNTPSEMKDKIDFLLKNPEQVMKIKENVHKRALPHDYHSRAQDLLNHFKLFFQ